MSLDTTWAEGRYGADVVDGRTPEALYDQGWAMALMEEVLRRLQGEREAAGRGREFVELRQFLSLHLPTTDSYLDVARRLGLSENAVTVSVFRLRRRYREVARKAICDTLANPTDDEIEAEWQDLLRVLGTLR